MIAWFTFALMLGLTVYTFGYLHNPICVVFLALTAISSQSL